MPSYKDHTSLLSEVGLFEPLSRAKIERIARGIPSRDVEVDEHVFTPAYRAEIFFLLLEGRVRVYRLEVGSVRFAGRHIVVEDTESLERIADDAA